MQALRVELDGTMTSFRYPHFLVGRQPSYPMPPPATIYGHIASALGEFPDRSTLRFAYCFTKEGVVDDLENAHLVEVASGRFDQKMGIVKNIEGNINPLLRQVFLFPHMVLYVDAPGWLDALVQAFRAPRYPVVLGRSQDLASYRSVDVLELEEVESGYVENTILPWTWRLRSAHVSSSMATMPRFIFPEDRRKVEFAPYVVLDRRVYVGADEARPTVIQRQPGERFEADPLSPQLTGGKRLIIWNRFDGSEG